MSQRTIARSGRVRLSASQTWELLIDAEAQRNWLGPASSIGAGSDAQFFLGQQSGPWCSGSVEAVPDHLRLVCRLQRFAGGPSAGARLTVQLRPASNDGTVIEVVGDYPDGETLAVDAEFWDGFWTRALDRLQSLAAGIFEQQRSLRQAVIVVHGIGEQEPGTTLRSLVEGVLDPSSPGRLDEDRDSWWKPDRTSRLFELRRVTLKATNGQRRPTTDVYELYWAHLIRDTTAAAVGSWLRHLVFRRRVPGRFQLLWFSFWIVGLVVAVGALASITGWGPGFLRWLTGGGVVVTLGLTVWRHAGRGLVVRSLGDAARYLTPRPGNIGHRQTIREAGIDLLDKLHRSNRYDRIVILGHSLGSVIAYDVIAHYWIMRGNEHQRLAHIDNSAATAINKALVAEPPGDPAKAQRLQLDAWLAARRNGQPWLVSDFVTIGSPLAMSDFLMASSADDFATAKLERRLPTCPPQPEIQKPTGHAVATYEQTYQDRGGGPSTTIRVFHHAAPFAVTRWTNLYFPPKLLKDPIGGPIGGLLGNWIRDVPLAAPKGKRFNLHSMYWRSAKSNDHIAQLRAALDLDLGKTLAQAVKQHSPLPYLPRADERP